MVEETNPAEEAEDEPVASTEKDESEAEPEETAQETEPEKEPEKSYTKAEVEEMFSKRGDRDYKKARREIEAELKDKPQDKQPDPVTAKPKLDDYESTEDWIGDTVRWERKAERIREDQESQTQTDTAEAAKVRRNFTRQTDRFEETHPDYQDAVDSIRNLEIPGYINEAVMRDDMGAELSYHLAKNHTELERILDMQPSAAIMALGRLSVKLEKKPDVKEVSKLPEPIEPISGGSKQDDVDYKKGDSFDKFMKVRNLEMGMDKQR